MELILQISGLISAISVIIGVIVGVYKFVDNSKRQNKIQNKEIVKIKGEQTLIFYATRACLDGLHQLGANGKVTEAIEKMDKYINKAGHGEVNYEIFKND